MTYEVGETYTTNQKVEICEFGFHYCENIDDVFTYYPYENGITKIFEIEDLGCGETYGDKSVTNKIKIVREIPFEEYNTLMSKHRFDDRGNLIWHRTSEDTFDTYTYDECNRKIKLDVSNGFSKTWEYGENGILQNCVSTIRGVVVHRWTYNEKGLCVRFDDITSEVWQTWTYDENNNVKRSDYSDGYWYAWTRNANGFIIKYTNAAGKVEHFTPKV